MYKGKKVTVVMPAYNAAKTLLPFLKTLPKFDEMILVDDSSIDKTYELAKKQKKLKVFKTEKNLGYGGNIKICLQKALGNGADIIVELHPDGEYIPGKSVEGALTKIDYGAKFVLGNRFTKNTGPLKSGMFLWKYPLIRGINIAHNLMLGTSIPDIHQGFRVYTKDFLKKADFLSFSNDYSFNFEIILKALKLNIKIDSVQIKTFYRGKKRGASFKNCFIYSLRSFSQIINFYRLK